MINMTSPDLRRAQRAGRLGGVRDVQGDLGRDLSGDPQAVAAQLGAVHPVPGLRILSQKASRRGLVGSARDHGFVARSYRPVRRDQPFLLPPDVREWLPADRVVWFLLETSAPPTRGPRCWYRAGRASRP
jgi:hypothetical protein